MVRTTRTTALLAALVVVLATTGCLGLVDDAASTETPTDRPTSVEVDGATTTDRPSTDAPSSPTASSPTASTPTSTTTPVGTPAGPSVRFVEDGERLATVTLEVADDAGERSQGLMNRESLAPDRGMVFVYPDADRRSFWMKNTLIPLDMVFVSSNGTVINVEHADVPPENSTDYGTHTSDGPAQYVVEVNRGFANETGIGPGTQVEFSGLNTTVDD